MGICPRPPVDAHHYATPPGTASRQTVGHERPSFMEAARPTPGARVGDGVLFVKFRRREEGEGQGHGRMPFKQGAGLRASASWGAGMGRTRGGPAKAWPPGND